MAHNINIISDKNDNKAKVTRFGQLVVAPLAYSDPILIELDTTNTAFNFIEPRAGESIVITDIIASANKSVSNTTPANVQIYQSDEVDSLVIVNGIVAPQLVGSANVDYIGLNMLVPEGRWVNATTDDATVLVTIMFYRVPVEFV